MRSYLPGFLTAIVFAVAPCAAQQWEIGGSFGYGFPRSVSVNTGTASGDTGFKNGYAFSVAGANHTYNHLSGELRYLFQKGDAMVRSGSTEARFASDSHAIHYDLLIQALPRAKKVRVYGAVGGGVRVFSGTGAQQGYQPLGNLVLLTKTQEWKPLLTAGGGVSIRIHRAIVLRLDIRDYLTPVPTKVLQPAPSAAIRGWLHDFVPLGGIGFTF